MLVGVSADTLLIFKIGESVFSATEEHLIVPSILWFFLPAHSLQIHCQVFQDTRSTILAFWEGGTQMSDEYSYRDAKLSLWQSSVSELYRRSSRPGGLAASPRGIGATPSRFASREDLMLPVHSVASAIEGAGKPAGIPGHGGKEGAFDFSARFDPLGDCARAAAHFLWAEIENNEADSRLYQGELRKAVCDVAGWSECLTTYLEYKALLEHPIYRPNQNPVFSLGTKTRLAMIGDWGTGEDVARNVLEQIAVLKPDVLIHLGDIYYAGTKDEARNNFLDICHSILGDIPCYSLCGNHDMYSGGAGYYWLLDQIGQKASYFCLKNDDWMFIGMDTGFHDNNPLNISTNMTKLVSEHGWSEAAWHLDQIKSAGSRKLVFLSHHQLFSPFSSVGSVDGVAYAYNPNLNEAFASVLPRVEWWFWGHEHTFGVFAPYIGLRRGRCVGASAVPVFSDQQQYATASGLKTLDGLPMPGWNPDGVLGTSANMYNNCFAMMTLNGGSATVDYYEVPLLQGMRKLNVTDTA